MVRLPAAPASRSSWPILDLEANRGHAARSAADGAAWELRVDTPG
jgi:hypothetical protein